MTDLDFITESNLKKTIENSIEYVYVLFDKSDDDKNKLFIEETYRVIILYAISIIEAILLYVYKKRGEELTKIEYKYVSPLIEGYKHVDDQDYPVVIAVQKKTSKKEREIGLRELVNFFEEKNLMKSATAEKILKINDVRNTFHLNKSRSSVKCNTEQVESAMGLLVYVIQRAPSALKVK